ncbi:MAG TPA: site-2 protease family protein [Trueperaceae bacterium]|nr:site-2 protease family protein [Trueperaceae bacterium]
MGGTGGLKLPFKLLGIPVRLDYSFLLILPLFAYIIGSQLPAYAELFRTALGISVDVSGITQGVTPWVLGLAGALGLFASVIVHELGHAVVARLYGVEVREIRLWFLGGVAQFDQMPKQRGAEAVVAIVGPIVSFAIGFGLLRLAPSLTGSSALVMLVGYVGITNVALALFNLIPAIPMDGGRVLRSLLALVLPQERATLVSTTVSGIMAIALGLYGFFSLQLWLVVMAFFIYNAGRMEAQASLLAQAFEGKTVADLMTPNPVTVTPDMRLAHFLQLIHFRPHTGYPVVDAAGELLGFARMAAAKHKPSQSGADDRGPIGDPFGRQSGGSEAMQEQQLAEVDPDATVADILEPAETIDQGASAMDALKRIGEGRLGRLVVTDAAGKVVGLLSKTDLVRELTKGQDAGPKRPV